MKEHWKRIIKIICISIFIILAALTYPAVEITSTPSFCSTCHEIKPAVESWKASDHGIIDGKTRATCRDCHIPSWNNPINVIVNKSEHGLKDIYHHFFSKEKTEKQDFYFSIKYKAIKSIPNDRCTVCHIKVINYKQDIIKTQDREIKGLHGAKDIKNLSCIMCHKHSGHLSFE